MRKSDSKGQGVCKEGLSEEVTLELQSKEGSSPDWHGSDG